MWRDNVQVALNEVLVQCETVARHYSYSRDAVGEGAVAGLFGRLAGQRESQAERLRYHLRQLHDLPDTADTELDTFHELTERLMNRLAARGTAALVRERVEDEERLAATATAALDEPVPAEVRTLLEHLRHAARAAESELKRALERET